MHPARSRGEGVRSQELGVRSVLKRCAFNSFYPGDSGLVMDFGNLERRHEAIHRLPRLRRFSALRI